MASSTQLEKEILTKKYIIWNSVVFIFFFGIMSVYLDKIPLVVWMLVGVIIEVLFRIIWGFIEKNDNDNITDKDCENYNKKRKKYKGKINE